MNKLHILMSLQYKLYLAMRHDKRVKKEFERVTDQIARLLNEGVRV